MTIRLFATRAPYYTVGEGQDGADVTMPLLAGDLAEALAGIRRTFDLDGIDISAIDVIDYVGDAKLLIVRTDLGAPTVLLFEPAEPGPAQADLLGSVAAASR